MRFMVGLLNAARRSLLVSWAAPEGLQEGQARPSISANGLLSLARSASVPSPGSAPHPDRFWDLEQLWEVWESVCSANMRPAVRTDIDQPVI